MIGAEEAGEEVEVVEEEDEDDDDGCETIAGL